MTLIYLIVDGSEDFRTGESNPAQPRVLINDHERRICYRYTSSDPFLMGSLGYGATYTRAGGRGLFAA